MKRIFLCSPYRGNIQRNVNLAKVMAASIAKANLAVFAPHLLYPQFLPEDFDGRRTGIYSGLAFLAVCDELWYYPVDGTTTPGMSDEIEHARRHQVKIRRIPEFTIKSPAHKTGWVIDLNNFGKYE